MVDISYLKPTLHQTPAPPGEVLTAPAPRRGTPLVAELRRAIDEEELCLYYQPIVDPVTGEIAGAEALVRWQHPERGLLGPAEFLETLECSELAPAFTDWVVEHAIAECARWPATWFVSLNISPRGLLLGAERDLRGQIDARCREHEVVPQRVWIELTEQGLVDETRLAAPLNALAEIGVQLAIDDYGAGAASLGRLRALPVHVAKIDRSLLGDLADPTRARILSLTVELAHACGARVIAEGVESEQQLAFVRDHGCEMAQGYHLARPMPAEALRLLATTVLGTPATSTHHLVLHNTEEEALEQLTDLVAPALHSQGRAIVVARANRLHGLAGRLSDQGLQLEGLREQGRLLEFDVEQLLDAILVDGHVDETLVGVWTTEVLGRLAPGGGPVRIYSELAPLIWERGHVDAEREFEAIWDRLERLPPRVMVCAYPTISRHGTGWNRSVPPAGDGPRGARALPAVVGGR